MKRISLTLLFLLSLTMGWSQNYSVNPQQASMEDYVKLLNFSKYEVFSFDVSSFVDSTRIFEFYYREYERENMVAEKRFCIYENRTMISEFNEQDQKEIHEEGSAFDEANGVYCVAQKIIIGFSPLNNDSTQRAYVDIENMTRGAMDLPLLFDPQIDPETGKESEYYSYGFREFLVNEIKFDTFIPLAMCGAYWYDAETQHHRFCGDIVLTEDMTSSLMTDVKEYYIIGMKVHK